MSESPETQESPEPPEGAELAPFVIEAARSGRSRCKSCRRAIARGALRLGVRIEGPYGVGYLWYHLNCAARRQPERLAEAYAAEAWKAAKEMPQNLPSLADLQGLAEQAESKKKEVRTLPYAEIAPSARAKCKHCDQPIEQGGLRVVLAREVVFGRQSRTTPIFVHPGCVAAELMAEDCLTEEVGLLEALRENSPGLDTAALASLERALGAS